MSRCPAAGHSSFKAKCPAVQNFETISKESLFQTFSKYFCICLELPSDSEKYFSFVVDKVSELVHTRKSYDYNT